MAEICESHSSAKAVDFLKFFFFGQGKVSNIIFK